MPADRPYRLVVFDWDGTLVDSVGSIVGCTRAALAELGVEGPPETDIRRSIGLGLAESVARLLPGGDPDAARRLREAYSRHWVEHWGQVSSPFPGSLDVLATLGRAGYLLAVATGKSRRGLARDFARTGLERHFHASRTADETASKPSPLMLLEILDELGVRAGEALMIGDTSWDLQMAANAGVDAVAVACGAQERGELEGHGALVCLEAVGELPGWLGREALAAG